MAFEDATAVLGVALMAIFEGEGLGQDEFDNHLKSLSGLFPLSEPGLSDAPLISPPCVRLPPVASVELALGCSLAAMRTHELIGAWS